MNIVHQKSTRGRDFTRRQREIQVKGYTEGKKFECRDNLPATIHTGGKISSFMESPFGVYEKVSVKIVD